MTSRIQISCFSIIGALFVVWKTYLKSKISTPKTRKMCKIGNQKVLIINAYVHDVQQELQNIIPADIVDEIALFLADDMNDEYNEKTKGRTQSEIDQDFVNRMVAFEDYYYYSE
eukprot:406527_1